MSSGVRDRWMAARQSELLPVPYLHVVFTVPRHLAHLALVNEKVFYDLLFHATRRRQTEHALQLLLSGELYRWRGAVRRTFAIDRRDLLPDSELQRSERRRQSLQLFGRPERA
jgi:hypothetical protein